MKDTKEKVYVWEFPVRFTHWINVLCILALSITGLYIGDPFTFAQSTPQYTMGWMRFIHFVAAYAFLMSIIIRLYWFIVGNKYAGLSEWTKVSEIGEDLKCYLLFRKRDKALVGCSALGGLSYLLLLLVFIFMVFSGFALYSVNHTGVIRTILGGWMTNIMYLQTIRLWHHLLMYVIFAFTLIHIYIIFFSESMEKTGMFTSIFSGHKFIPGKDLD